MQQRAGLAMPNENTISGLNQLVRTNKDAEAGLRVAADHIKNSELESLLTGYAKQHAEFARQLEAEIERLGGEVTHSGGLSETIHRGWMELKSAAAGTSIAGLLSLCESGEDSAEIAYHDVCDEIRTGQAHALIAKHHEQIKGFQKRLCRISEEVKNGLVYPENEAG